MRLVPLRFAIAIFVLAVVASSVSHATETRPNAAGEYSKHLAVLGQLSVAVADDLPARPWNPAAGIPDLTIPARSLNCDMRPRYDVSRRATLWRSSPMKTHA